MRAHGSGWEGRQLCALAGKWFSLSAGVILLVTGAAKIISIFGVARVLESKVPLLGVRFAPLFLWVGLAELVIAGLCLHPRTRRRSVGWVAAISTSFLLYRGALWWAGWPGLCGCMGNLTGELGLSAETAESILKVALVYLLVGSYGTLAWRWRHGWTA